MRQSNCRPACALPTLRAVALLVAWTGAVGAAGDPLPEPGRSAIVTQPVVWTNLVKASASGSHLVKTSAGTGFDGGGVSTRALQAHDGYLEFTASETTTHRMIGLSRGDSGSGSADIDFAIYMTAGGLVQIHEAGAGRGSFGTYASGDVFRIAIESGAVVYRKNGAAFYLSAVTPAFPLLVDSSLYHMGATVKDVVISGVLESVAAYPVALFPPSGLYPEAQTVSATTFSVDATIHYTIDGTDPTESDPVISSTALLQVDHNVVVKARAYAPGLFPGPVAVARYAIGVTPTTEPVVWTSLVNASALGSHLAKIGSVAGFNAGGVSTRAIISVDGYVELTATEIATHRLIGLSCGDAGQASADIDFALYLTAGGPVQIYELGIFRGAFGTYATGDRFRVAVEAGVVVYRKNGAVIYTSPITPRFPLLVDTSLFHFGATLKDVVISGVLESVAASPVALTPPAGAYAEPQDVQMSTDTPGASIHYTLTGADPTEADAAIASGDTVRVDHGLVLKARAYVPGLMASPVSAVRYDIGVTPATEPVVWTNLVNTAAQGSSLAKTAGDPGFTAGGVSTKGIVADGYVELTASETTTLRMIGLSHGDGGPGSGDIDFALYLTAGGPLQLHELGVNRGTFGTYASGDLLRVAVESGIVVYRKNGVALYTSTIAPRSPLLVDASLHSMGATLKDVVISGVLEPVAVSSVALAPPSGVYTETQSVVVSTDTPGAAIHYTTNGADPTESDAVIASGGSVEVDHSLILKARAYTSGLFPSPVAVGRYAIGVEPATEAVVWTNMVNTAASGGGLAKVAGEPGFNAGAVSTKGIVSLDGYVELTATDTMAHRLIGLSHGDSNQSQTDLDFAIYLAAGGALHINELGLQRGTFGTYAAGDRLRVAVESGSVVYRKNGTVLYASVVAPRFPLLVDTSIYHVGGSVKDVVISGVLEALAVAPVTLTPPSGIYADAQSVAVATDTPGATIRYTTNGVDPTEADAVIVSGGVLLVDHSQVVKARAYATGLMPSPVSVGRYAIGVTPTTEPVVWTSLVHTVASGSHLAKVAGPDGFNGGAVSTKGIASLDGYVEFTATETTTHRLIGLSHGDSSQTQADIDFAIYLAAGGAVHLYEVGLNRGTFGTYANGDRFRVALESGTVVYRRNGVAFYTSVLAPRFPLLVDTSLYYLGATLKDVVISGILEAVAVAPVSLTPPSGVHAAVQAVVVSTDTPGATIHYTTNGADPTEADAVITSGTALSVDRSLVLKARAYAPPLIASPVAVGRYAIGVTPATEPVSWTNLVNAVGSAGGLAKVAGAPGFNAGGISTRGIASLDGYVEFTVAETTTHRLIGLSYGDSSQTHADIDFAVYLAAGGALYVYEHGLTRGTFGTHASGDRLRIAVESGVVVYRKNGIAFYTSIVAPRFPLLVDTSMYHLGAAVKDVVISGVLEAVAVSAPVFSPGSGVYAEAQTVVVTTDTPGATIRYTTSGLDPTVTDPAITSGGTLSVDRSVTLKARAFAPGSIASAVSAAHYAIGVTPSTEPVAWTSLVNATATGSDLARSGGTIGFNAGGVSTKVIVSPDGHVELIASETSTHRLIGLSHGNSGESASDIDFAFYLGAGGPLYIQEMGVLRGTFGTYATGDRLRVALESGAVVYRKNGTLLYTSAVAPRLPLLVDTSLYHAAATVKQVVVSGVLEPVALEAPVFTPPSGGYPLPINVHVTAAPGAAIRYAITGSAPVPTDPVVPSDGNVTIGAPLTLKAVASKAGYVDSDVATGIYTATLGTLPAPTITPPGGRYLSPPTVTISISRPSAALYYTTDGSVPTAASTLYTGPFVVGSSQIVTARAFELHWDPSPPVSETYEIGAGSVAAGAGSRALTTAGALFQWGRIQQDDGTMGTSQMPLPVTGLTDVVEVQAGESRTYALRADGTVWGWGPNDDGLLGDDTQTSTSVPVQIFGLTEVQAISVGFAHVLALKTDGTVWGWGDNDAGQVGNGSTDPQPFAVPVPGLGDVQSIAAAGQTSYALKLDGSVWAWGDNSLRQLGRNGVDFSTVPLQVPTLPPVTSLFTGPIAANVFALEADGTPWGWGFNAGGHLCLGSITDSELPVQVPVSDVKAFSEGGDHTLVVKHDGSVWACGFNYLGQLGDGTTTDHATATRITGLPPIVQVAGGWYHSLARTLDNSVWSWGNNEEGQLGDGTFDGRLSPVSISGPGFAWTVTPLETRALRSPRRGGLRALTDCQAPASTATEPTLRSARSRDLIRMWRARRGETECEDVVGR
jgi:hypothetical protein